MLPLVIEDVLFPCFWQWTIIAIGQTVKQTEGTTASDESFRWLLFLVKHLDEIAWKCSVSSSSDSIPARAATA